MKYALNYSDTRILSLKIKLAHFPDGFRLNSVWPSQI